MLTGGALCAARLVGAGGQVQPHAKDPSICADGQLVMTQVHLPKNGGSTLEVFHPMEHEFRPSPEKQRVPSIIRGPISTGHSTFTQKKWHLPPSKCEFRLVAIRDPVGASVSAHQINCRGGPFGHCPRAFTRPPMFAIDIENASNNAPSPLNV